MIIASACIWLALCKIRSGVKVYFYSIDDYSIDSIFLICLIVYISSSFLISIGDYEQIAYDDEKW